MAVTLSMESSEAKEALAAARAEQGLVLIVPRINGHYARVGTIAKIEDTGRLPNGSEVVVICGLSRGIIGAGVPGIGSALRVQVEAVSDDNPSPRAVELSREYKAIVENLLDQQGASDAARFLRGMSDPGQIADTAGYSPLLSPEQKVEALETLDVEERLEKLIAWGREALAESSLKDKIRTDVTSGLDKAQREHLLRMQMDAIRKELGESDGSVADEYRKKIADANMPETVRTHAEREVDRFERMGESNAESSMIRTYLDWLLAVPWDKRSEDHLDPVHARAVLDADHEGLEDVKRRITEYLAVRKLRTERGLTENRRSGVILTLIGPPGTGKTSIGESIARATGRQFVRMSLGGVRDEAEIRGHRRTYIGALPGRLVRALRDAGTMNPVIMLDEVDKIGADYRGDPSSALLEVLDPEQNFSFRDHYLGVAYDLSNVMFIVTGNVLDTIQPAFLDRMEVIRLSGYTDEEKLMIAKQHLIPI